MDVDTAPAGFDESVRAFLATLGGKSPRTYATYQSGLARFREYLEARGQLESWRPDQLVPSSIEEFYSWLVRRHSWHLWSE